MRGLAPLALLLLLPACQFKRQEAPAIYAPWEEGQTMGFENPSLATPELRRESRYQVRVSEGLLDPTKAGLTKLTQASLQMPPSTYVLRLDEGGVELLSEDGKVISVRLPKGFPDRVSEWDDPQLKLHYRVLGPAAWDNPAQVKNVQDPVGIWIEISSGEAKGRALYLRGLGEVERQVWREGRWITVNRLVDMAKTDDHQPVK